MKMIKRTAVLGEVIGVISAVLFLDFGGKHEEFLALEVFAF